MNHKALLGTAVAAALMFGAQAVSACAISAWSSATGIVAGDAGEPGAGFKRYAGRCGLRVADAATPRFVTDTTPNAEATYKNRFYYFTGNISGLADIFQARNTGGTNIIRVTHNGDQLGFTVNGGASTQNITVLDNRYYGIEIDWAAGAGTGSMTVAVTGAGGVQAGTLSFPTLSNSADSITEARMGIIAGTPTVTSAVFFDEFDSRRTTSPGLLVRGDANNNSSVTPADATAVINEFNNGIIAAGQPDCGENGTVSPADATCIINIFNGL